MAEPAVDFQKAAREFAERARQRANDGGKAEEWAPVDREMATPRRLPAPAFPTDVFGAFWSSWLTAAAEAKSAPVDYPAMSLLSCASGLLANVRRASPWAGWIEPSIIWTLLVGIPSSGKSPGQDAVLDLVRKLEIEADADFDERKREHVIAIAVAKNRRLTWETEVAKAVKESRPPPHPPLEMEAPDAPARRRLFSSDPTIEKLSRLVAASPRGFLLARDELAGWLGAMDRYSGSGSDRAFYLEAFGGRAFVVDRVKDPEAVRLPFLSVAVTGGGQPDRVSSLLFRGDDDGLAARFLYAWPEPGRPRRPRCAHDEQAGLTALRWLLTLSQDEEEKRPVPRVLPFDPEAARTLDGFRSHLFDIEKGAAGLFQSWLGKLPGMAARIALILEFLWWCGGRPLQEPEPTTISAKAVNAALGLLDGYCTPMARRTFGDAALPQADRDAAALARWIISQETLPTVINARDLRHRSILQSKEPERYDRALEELTAAGWVRPAPRREGTSIGRQTKTYEVNPAVGELP